MKAVQEITGQEREKRGKERPKQEGAQSNIVFFGSHKILLFTYSKNISQINNYLKLQLPSSLKTGGAPSFY